MFLASIFSDSKKYNHILAKITMMNERHSAVMKQLRFTGLKPS